MWEPGCDRKILKNYKLISHVGRQETNEAWFIILGQRGMVLFCL